jgi:nitrate/TMAO reductase-like tetraheme cytochrome c subunit
MASEMHGAHTRHTHPPSFESEDCIVPAGSSKKRERQYEHIKEGYQDRGVSKDEAEERAARTVNKERRHAGETKNKKD